MIAVASYESVIIQGLRFKKVYIPTIATFAFANLAMLVYLNLFVIDLNNALDARLIPISGFLLVKH